MGELSIFICLGEHDHDGEMPGVASTTFCMYNNLE